MNFTKKNLIFNTFTKSLIKIFTVKLKRPNIQDAN